MNDILFSQKRPLDIATSIMNELFKNRLTFDIHFGGYCIQGYIIRIYCENFTINIYWFKRLHKTKIDLEYVPDYVRKFIKTLL